MAYGIASPNGDSMGETQTHKNHEPSLFCDGNVSGVRKIDKENDRGNNTICHKGMVTDVSLMRGGRIQVYDPVLLSGGRWLLDCAIDEDLSYAGTSTYGCYPVDMLPSVKRHFIMESADYG